MLATIRITSELSKLKLSRRKRGQWEVKTDSDSSGEETYEPENDEESIQDEQEEEKPKDKEIGED